MPKITEDDYLAPRVEAPVGSADRVRDEALTAVGYDANGEPVDMPVERRPQLPDMEKVAQATLWPAFDGITPNSVEVAFGGRVELSMGQADRNLAQTLSLNSRHMLVVGVTVKEKTHKALDKKGSFDGVTGVAKLKITGVKRLDDYGHADPGDAGQYRAVLEAIAARAARVRGNGELTDRFIHDLIDHPLSAGLKDDLDGGLSDALDEALGDDAD